MVARDAYSKLMRIGLTGALVSAAGLALSVRSGRPRFARPSQPEDDEGRQPPKPDADQRPREDIERKVDPQIDARQGNCGGEAERVRTHPRAENRDRGRRREGGRRVPGRERGVLRDRDQRAERWVDFGRARATEQLLERAHDEGRGNGRRRGREADQRRAAAAAEITSEPKSHQQRPLDPPRREHDEDRGQNRMLDGGGMVHQHPVEFDEGRQQVPGDASTTARLLLVVNGRASGVEEPGRIAAEMASILAELGASADAVVTSDEADLFEALRGAVATERRVVLVGGDGSLHSAANAPLRSLPELALVPAGRANNIARALRIPTDRAGALAVAASAPTRPVDALLVETPERSLYALEAVSAGFQAEARSGYEAENSADLWQGVGALARAVQAFTPYRVRARVDGSDLVTGGAAQLFLSNLPYFGFGFEVDPGADPADGRLEAILIEASSRGALLRSLAAAYRGHHIGRGGVRRISARRAELTEPLPLVADAVPLGTTTATVSVEPGRLRVAAPPGPGGSA
jgi:diacylglycerol kinase (ATP)